MADKAHKKPTKKPALVAKMGDNTASFIKRAREHLTSHGLSPRPTVRDDGTRQPDAGLVKYLPTLDLSKDGRFEAAVSTAARAAVSKNSKSYVYITPALQTPGRVRRVIGSPASISSVSLSRSSPRSRVSSPRTSRVSQVSQVSSPRTSCSKTSSRAKTASSTCSKKKPLHHYLPGRNGMNLTVVPSKLTAEVLKMHTILNTESPVPSSTCNEGEFNTSNGLTPDYIVFSENFNDMYVFMQTQFGDRFIAYFPPSVALSPETIRDFADLPTSIAISLVLKSEATAEVNGLCELSFRAGNAAGNIRPEIFSCEEESQGGGKGPKGPLIGAAAVEIGEDGPYRICAVVYNDSGDTEFVGVIAEDENCLSREIVIYPIVNFSRFSLGQESIVHAVHSVFSTINERSFSDAKSELENSMARMRGEVQWRLDALLARMSEALPICDRGENEIAIFMSESAACGNSEAYGNLATQFKNHRLYAAKVGDSASAVARIISQKIEELAVFIKRQHAELYVGSRRTLSPDTAEAFLSAANWGYPQALDYAVFKTDRYGPIVDSNGKRIVEADDFPELVGL